MLLPTFETPTVTGWGFLFVALSFILFFHEKNPYLIFYLANTF